MLYSGLFALKLQSKRDNYTLRVYFVDFLHLLHRFFAGLITCEFWLVNKCTSTRFKAYWIIIKYRRIFSGQRCGLVQCTYIPLHHKWSSLPTALVRFPNKTWKNEENLSLRLGQFPHLPSVSFLLTLTNNNRTMSLLHLIVNIWIQDEDWVIALFWSLNKSEKITLTETRCLQYM